MNDKGVHETHCCKIHGCKYSDNDCPVAYGDSPGNEACEYCAMDMELDGHMGNPKTNDINELRALLSEAEERCKSLGGEVNHYSALCGKYKGRAEAAEAKCAAAEKEVKRLQHENDWVRENTKINGKE